jgi:hypothetical protein
MDDVDCRSIEDSHRIARRNPAADRHPRINPAIIVPEAAAQIPRHGQIALPGVRIDVSRGAPADARFDNQFGRPDPQPPTDPSELDPRCRGGKQEISPEPGRVDRLADHPLQIAHRSRVDDRDERRVSVSEGFATAKNCSMTVRPFAVDNTPCAIIRPCRLRASVSVASSYSAVSAASRGLLISCRKCAFASHFGDAWSIGAVPWAIAKRRSCGIVHPGDNSTVSNACADRPLTG